MPVFETKEQAYDVFSRLFDILVEDETFATKATAQNLSLHLVHTKPDVELHVNADEGVVAGPPAQPAVIRIKMSCDVAHALWMGDLLVPLALATGRMRIKGNIPKVLEFVPLLRPAFDRYPEIAAEAGVAG